MTAAVRIDNRDDMLRALSLRGPDVTDADLILAAYERWGACCAEHLIGAFAFAVWDAGAQRLVLARDTAGVRPLYYSHGAGRPFQFASAIQGLLAMGASRQPDPLRVADYLADIIDNNTYTFYRSIRRLPPGHTLVASPAGVSVERYWSPDPTRTLSLASDEEYAEGFREVFGQAVRSRLRARGPVGVLLSGGLDSSAVAVVANAADRGSGRTLHAFSNVFPHTPECDERSYIEAVLSAGRYRPHFVEAAGQTRPLSATATFVRAYGQPVYAPAASQMLGLYARAREEGVRVLLDGHGGDEVVSQGFGYLKDLAAAGRWLTLLREVTALGDQDAHRNRALLYTLHLLFGLAERSRRAPPVRRVIQGAMRVLQRSGAQRRADPTALVAAALAADVNLPERARSFAASRPQRARSERGVHLGNVTSPLQPLAFEVMDSLATANGVERRSPFWDRRVVEFCLSLPSDQVRRRGFGRYILRRALRDILPPLIAARPHKTRFDANVRQGIVRNDRNALADLLAAPTAGIESFVDPDAAMTALDGFGEGASMDQVFLALKLTALKAWVGD